MTKIRQTIPLPVVSVASVLLVWATISAMGLLKQTAFPPVSDVLRSGGRLWASGYLTKDILVTLGRVFPGLFIGSAFGVMLGLFTGRIRPLAELVAPWLHFSRSLPAVALAPFLIALLGLSEVAKITIISAGVFFPVWLNTHEGSASVPLGYLEVAVNLGLPWKVYYTKLVLPSSLPLIIAGIRTGIGMAFVMGFIAEYINSAAGIGCRLSLAYTVGDTGLMAFSLLELGCLSLLTDFMYDRLTSCKSLWPWLTRSA